MPRRDLQVIEIGEGWAVRREGELILQSVHETMQEAEEAAVKQAAAEEVDVYIQGREGRFHQSTLAPASKPRPRGGPRHAGR